VQVMPSKGGLRRDGIQWQRATHCWHWLV